MFKVVIMHEIQNKIRMMQAKVEELESEKLLLMVEIERLQRIESQNMVAKVSTIAIQQDFTIDEKVQIFMNLFRGRAEVFAKRWDNSTSGKSGYSPACFNEWVRGVCYKPQIKCSVCTRHAFIPMNSTVVHKHLGGENYREGNRDYTIGIYPMLRDDKCWFLAVDFDKEQWQRDIGAFITTCKSKNIPVSIERSRSGNGGHLWFFFQQAIPAVLARKMGAALLTETMEKYPEIGFESYDRFFPNQDTLSSGGFGNLIGLPLQYFPRKLGNSLFLDDSFTPYHDQWAYLASIVKMTPAEVNKIVESTQLHGNVLGLPMPHTEEDSKRPWELLPSRLLPDITIPPQLLPNSVTIILGNQLFIPKQNLPPILINKMMRLAAFQNPEFYKAQAMRLPVFDKPRVIACAEYFTDHLGLPRGCLDECVDLLKSLNIEVILQDKRNLGNNIKLKFLGKLTVEQKKSATALLQHDTGVLAATTAFGKTVVGVYIISKRKTNTLIIVHRVQLMEQWVERLRAFLNITPEQLGVIGNGKRKPSGIIDIAVMQSLIKKNAVDDIVANYGQIIVDECHHLSAVSFESVARACKAKYVLGLTATATRKDGHQPIIFMQCGPVRYTVSAKQQAQLRPFTHRVIVRNSPFSFLPTGEQKITIGQLYAEIIADANRNQIIINDVLLALQSGRSPLLITERKDHVTYFAQQLSKFCKNIVIMVGGQSVKQRTAVTLQLSSIPDNEERLLIATGKYIGEGFDDARLDTLFLTMPISWQGTLAQYAGRLHRAHQDKKEVLIYDYVDNNVPMLDKMSEKRIKGYENLGYSISKHTELL